MHRCMGCMREYDARFDVCPYCGYILDTPAKNKNHLSPGTLLQDRYVLGKVLGQGGFGITYIAWDQRLEKPVAVKEFFPTSFAARMTGCNDISCFDDESRHYFESGMKNMLDESRRLAQFTDLKNVVQVLDCIEENGTAYIIMELLRGETVQDILRRDGKMSLEQSMGIMMPILQALEQIHRTGLVHRDVSPDNIFLCEDGQAKLLDFGAARIASGLDHKTLSIMLKKGFAPIEQYNSHGTQGSFTDVYAVCATLYKMLTGVTPEDSLSRMTQDKLRPLSDMVSIPKSIERILQKGMAVQASDRIQTAGELYARLRQALQEEQARAAAQQTPKQKKKRKIAGKGIRMKNIRIACLSAAAVLLVAAIVAGIVFGVPWLRSRRASEEKNSSRMHLYNADWSLEGTVLYIFGQDAMPEFSWEGEGINTDMVTEVVIEQGISTVASCAFYGFLNLKAVSMANSVTAIGSFAFYGCPKLQTIRIPSSVMRIGPSAFSGSGIISNTTYWKSGLFCIDHCLIRASNSLTGSIKIPSNISVIAEGAFEGCNVDGIEIPNGVTRLSSTFYGCNARFVRLPDSVTQIVDAFIDNSSTIEIVVYQGTEEQWNNIQFLGNNKGLQEALIKFDAQSLSPFAGLQVGDTVKFGTFEQDNNTDNGQEEIDWLVIDTSEDGGSLLLLSRQALYCTAYNQERAPTTWKACSVRQWLNGSFYKDHFTADEREYILKTQLETPDNERYKTSGGEDTEDYIFLLSLQQAESMQAASRKAKPTAYAINCGAFEHEETGNTWWTLRSPGSANTLCAIVRSDGEVRAGGEAVDASGSIRPAMWVSA